MSLAWSRFIMDPGYNPMLPPFPIDMVATQTWVGTYQGWYGSRGTNNATQKTFEGGFEFDFGSHATNTGDTIFIRGFNVVSPLMNQPLTGSITLVANIHCRRENLTAGITVRPVAAFYVWNANDTVGTVYANAVVGPVVGATTYGAISSMSSLQAGGVTFPAGCRFGVDLYYRVQNVSAGGIFGRYAYMQFGDATLNGNFGVSGASNLRMLQGILQPMAGAWGAN
jgi:hypothetical protein